MIICINYRDDGERYIARIEYVSSRYEKYVISIANGYSEQYDEVYIIDFKENKEFVDEVVLRGCRI